MVFVLFDIIRSFNRCWFRVVYHSDEAFVASLEPIVNVKCSFYLDRTASFLDALSLSSLFVCFARINASAGYPPLSPIALTCLLDTQIFAIVFTLGEGISTDDQAPFFDLEDGSLR